MKPRFPPEHYPIPAIQHTRAVVALTAALCNFEMCKVTPPTFVALQMARINRWAEECKTQTIKKKLSQGAKRAMNACFDVFGTYLDSEITPEPSMQRRCAVMVYVALTFIEDVRATCPIYWDGPCNRAWRYLLLNVGNLATKLDKLHHDMEDEWVELYMQSACALYGEKYESDM